MKSHDVNHVRNDTAWIDRRLASGSDTLTLDLPLRSALASASLRSAPLRSAPFRFSTNPIHGALRTGWLRASRKLPHNASRRDRRHTCAVAIGKRREMTSLPGNPAVVPREIPMLGAHCVLEPPLGILLRFFETFAPTSFRPMKLAVPNDFLRYSIYSDFFSDRFFSVFVSRER